MKVKFSLFLVAYAKITLGRHYQRLGNTSNTNFIKQIKINSTEVKIKQNHFLRAT